MSEPGKKRWLIKDKEGRVRGPFYTDEVLTRISRGEFSGEEMIALYPNTDWIPISQDPEFYDQLLSFLDSERDSEPSAGEMKIELEPIEEIPDDFVEGKPTPPPNVNRVHRVHEERFEEKSEPSSSDVKNEKSGPAKEKKESDKFAKEEPVIELKKFNKVLTREKAKMRRGPFALMVLAAFGVALYLIFEPRGADGRIQLLAPRKGRPPVSDDQLKPKIQKAVIEYTKDNFADYMHAQSLLVEVLEGSPRNAGGIALLCLNYLELWPFARQDASDLQAISTAMQMASQVDPAGVEASTCRTVDLLVRGRLIEAKGVTEMVLDTFGQVGKPPIAFYYFKARLFDAAKDYVSAKSYAKSAAELWRGWLRAQVLEADMAVKSGQYNEAANLYRNILKSNPNHKAARIGLGVVEYRYLKNYQVGQHLLEGAMAQNEQATREVLARGYMGLAEIALLQQDKSKALSYAQKAYAFNSLDPRTKEIIVSIGGEKKLRETKRLDSQLVYEGDQLVREGDCNGAQAHYKAAYEANGKNALAAMKAAECLWSLSLSTEAYKWLDNAIRADANLIDAYVLLADYYSQRFNYDAAGRILSKARAQSPKSYKVFRGFALVELRRNNFKGAVAYAEKAVQLYEADVESYVILAQARLYGNESSKAFEAASKAIEIDMNHREAQIIYGRVLFATKGATVGIDYLNRLVNTYPTITEYRLALGQLYYDDQSYSTAQRIFEQVTKIDDMPKKGFIALGKSLQMQKKYDEARDAYFKAAAIDPSDAEPLFLAGQLYLEAKQPSEARLQFQRVLRNNKEYPLVNYFIGEAALQMGSVQEALDQANLEKAKNPKLADPYLLAAEAFSAMKQYSACAGEYQQAVNLRPLGSDLYVKMARCYRMSGNLDAAVSMVNQASRIESGNPEVWKEQGAIYEVRQDAIKAIEAYNQYLLLAPNAPDRDQIQGRLRALQGSY